MAALPDIKGGALGWLTYGLIYPIALKHRPIDSQPLLAYLYPPVTRYLTMRIFGNPRGKLRFAQETENVLSQGPPVAGGGK